jgi:hypothetical protein
MKWVVALIIALAIVVLVMLSGCCSGDPAGRPGDGGWSISLVNITVQLGGSRTDPTITTRNEVGPNAVQTHSVPVKETQSAGATSIPVTP